MARVSNSSESSRWLAVSRRDRSANSSFFYGAISTHIFCRPTCPGRLARRSNVVFFDNQNQAISSGYRPCKRCQPCNDDWSRGSEGRMLAYCLRDLIIAAQSKGAPWTVEAFAKEMGISGAHLHRQFKRHYKVTPKSFGASLKSSVLPQPGQISQVEGQTVEDTPNILLQPDEEQLFDLLQLDFIDNFLERSSMEGEWGHTTLDRLSLDGFDNESCPIEEPSSGDPNLYLSHETKLDDIMQMLEEDRTKF